MSTAVLYHNPRCSKSRQALALLSSRKVEVDVFEYLKESLSYKQVNDLFNALPLSSAHDMIRPQEPEYNEAGLSKTTSNQEVLKAIVAYPKLLERPILKIDNRAAIGRPIENIEALIGG